MARPAQIRSGYKTFLLTHTNLILTNLSSLSTTMNYINNIKEKISAPGGPASGWKDFFLKNEQKMVLIVAFCLISAISYEFGVLQGQKWQQKPLIIEKPANISEEQKTSNSGNSEPSGVVLGATSQATVGNTGSATDMVNLPAGKAGCAFVGSKNSNKFYPPTCSYAKRIKPENVVCFKSAEEAIRQGRTESKCN